LKIGNTDDLSSYLSWFYQGIQKTSGSTASSSATGNDQTVSGTGSPADTLEISDEAYLSLNGSGAGGRMGPPPPPEMTGDAGDSNPITGALDSLVSEGTITDEQAGAIASAIQEAMSGGSAPDTADADAGTQSAVTNPLESLLGSLVSDGTLTEDQAASAAQALTPPPPPPPPLGMGGPGDTDGASAEDGSSGEEDAASVSGAADTSDETSVTDDSDEDTDLIKNIVNSLLSSGTNSKDSISTLLQLLNSLDTETLKTVYADLSGSGGA
jgi:hypothetical protein